MADPILNVKDMAASLRYYSEVLGFQKAPWGDLSFTQISRDGASIYLCQGAQGGPGTWVWLGVSNAGALYEEVLACGAKIIEKPRNYHWAYEFRVQDPDGHVLRFGSEPRDDLPFEKS